MELNWKEIEAERTVRSLSEQVRVTGEMPSPDGRDVSNVLASSAQVCIENASPSDGVIDLDGRIVVTVTALDPDGRPFSFESGASFSHRIETDDASVGMQAEITPRIQELNVTPSENGAKLDASIDLMVSVISSIPIRAIDGVSGLSDLEMKTREIRHMRKRSLGSSFVRMREELAADGIEDVVSAEGIIAVRDVACDQGAATISGVISVSAVTIDQNAHMGQLVRQVPFREKINMDPCGGEGSFDATEPKKRASQRTAESDSASANFSGEAISGRNGLPDCLHASNKTSFQRPPTESESGRATDRPQIIGTMRRTPSSAD